MKDIPHLGANGRGCFWPGLFLILYLVLPVWSGCGTENREQSVRFSVEAGPAVDTLKEAARHTPVLKGKYTPSEAFELMLADSPYIVVQHQQSGVYSIQKAPMPSHP